MKHFKSTFLVYDGYTSPDCVRDKSEKSVLLESFRGALSSLLQTAIYVASALLGMKV